MSAAEPTAVDVVHVTGARPNFPKAAPVIAALAAQQVGGRPLRQLLVHTGQHYDDKLSRVFFDELGLPDPDVNLGVGSGSHAAQTAAVMVGLEQLFLERSPSLVVLYGDVNSTVAAALVAAKLQIEVAHVEAGLRSFDNAMPEEINRRVTDQLSRLLFVTSAEAIGHLAREGLPDAAMHFVGNPMIDTLLANLPAFDEQRQREQFGLTGDYAVATLHRPSNVDDPAAVAELVSVLRKIGERLQLVIPLHPRGRASLAAAGLLDSPGVMVVDPLPYTAFMGLVRGAVAVLTDSGGVQEETTVLGVPCLTMRANTERPVTITHGTNQLVSTGEVVRALDEVLSRAGLDAAGRPAVRPAPDHLRPPLWDGAAGPRIAAIIARHLDERASVSNVTVNTGHTQGDRTG
jgi:UDP-N-acetylglucosamine 2-epimerase (non-hydrolysing)